MAVREIGTLVQKQLFAWLTRRRGRIGAAEKEMYGNWENSQNRIVVINKLSLSQLPAFSRYFAAGKDGQYIYIVLEQHLTSVRFGGTDPYRHWDDIFHILARGLGIQNQ